MAPGWLMHIYRPIPDEPPFYIDGERQYFAEAPVRVEGELTVTPQPGGEYYREKTPQGKSVPGLFWPVDDFWCFTTIIDTIDWEVTATVDISGVTLSDGSTPVAVTLRPRLLASVIPALVIRGSDDPELVTWNIALGDGLTWHEHQCWVDGERVIHHVSPTRGRPSRPRGSLTATSSASS